MALAKGEPKRLVITAPPFKSWYREIRLDGCDIGRLETKQECLEGRTFALGDGTTLRVSIEPPSFLRGGACVSARVDAASVAGVFR